MPGTKNKSGGKRKGAGRKSKAEEMGLKALLDKCWTQAQRESCIRSLAAKAKRGEMEAIKLLMAYAFGRPTERHEHDFGDKIMPIITEVICERRAARHKQNMEG